MPAKYQPDRPYLRHVKTNRVHVFTIIQIFSTAVLYLIKYIDMIAISFPILVSSSRLVWCLCVSDLRVDLCSSADRGHMRYPQVIGLHVHAAGAVLVGRHSTGQRSHQEPGEDREEPESQHDSCDERV